MTLHGSKFDEHILKSFRNEACGLPKEAGMMNSKVVASAPKLTPELSTVEVINHKWQSIVQSATGYDSYESFRLGVNRELGRRYGLAP